MPRCESTPITSHAWQENPAQEHAAIPTGLACGLIALIPTGLACGLIALLGAHLAPPGERRDVMNQIGGGMIAGWLASRASGQ